MYNCKGHPSSFKGTPEKETPNVLHAPEVHFLDIHCAFSLRKPLQEADYYPWLSEAHEGNTRAFSRNLRFDIRLHRKLSCKYKWSLRKGDSNMLFIPWFCNAYPCWSITWLMCAHWRNDRFYPAFRLLVRELNMWSITEQTRYVCSRFRGKIDPVSFVQRTRKYFSLASYRLTVRTSCSVLGIFSEVFSGRYKGICTGC